MVPIAHTIIIATCLWQGGLVTAGEAGIVHRWTDAQGQTHFSDAEPVDQASTTIELPPAAPRTPTGLRPGEQVTLHTIEQRRQDRHKAAEATRRDQRRLRDARRKACRDKREQLRRGRRHVDSKAVSKYLREHCW
jgi:hypothetical protein